MADPQTVFSRPQTLVDRPWHFCPGCHHGIAHRLCAEVIAEMGLQERTVGVGSVGCGVFSYEYFNFDGIGPSHGRAPAVATGVKRVLPDHLVFTYQGDGDLAAIGTTEMVHTAVRGELITIIFINNTVYGMTGGQMAPTTLMGQVTTTSPFGRESQQAGYPVQVCEMLATQKGAAYIARAALFNPAQVNRAKKCIRKAFETQIQGLGFSLVEILAACPTNWGMSPLEACRHVETGMVPVFPLGEYKVPGGGQ
ncbi:MAG: thiamine pyrophosphate-dependent enzyme [Heliobacteriaceae bacterium]|nr:thiamine pyrophosphate-dependent enzyme [Heliobacteriaceae bacterium]MDD4587567.1 thiamine pyrophosphate-dependent enzyme [Heliobacteriaceae bacterium]